MPDAVNAQKYSTVPDNSNVLNCPADDARKLIAVIYKVEARIEKS